MALPDETDLKILGGIQEVARLHLRIEGEIVLETPLIEAWRLDSLRMLTLVAELENRFQVILEEGDERRVKTVADLVSLLRERGAGA